MEQLTIFDLIPSDEPFEGKTIEQIVTEISILVGIYFKPKVWEWDDHQTVEYVAKLGKKDQLTIEEDFYQTRDEKNGQRFIGVEYTFGLAGGGCPCDSIDEAVQYLKRRKTEYYDRFTNKQ